MERLLVDLSINVTSMLRDPSFYVAFHQKIVPARHTYPFTRICAGCSTTDINEHVLQAAREGVFPLERMKQHTQNYIRGGGKGDFSEYYVAAYDSVRFARSLTENVVFAQHNLAMGRSFNEFNAIVCRKRDDLFRQRAAIT